MDNTQQLYTPENKLFIPKNYTVFVKPTDYSMSTRKLEGLKRLAEIRS